MCRSAVMCSDVSACMLPMSGSKFVQWWQKCTQLHSAALFEFCHRAGIAQGPECDNLCRTRRAMQLQGNSDGFRAAFLHVHVDWSRVHGTLLHAPSPPRHLHGLPGAHARMTDSRCRPPLSKRVAPFACVLHSPMARRAPRTLSCYHAEKVAYPVKLFWPSRWTTRQAVYLG